MQVIVYQTMTDEKLTHNKGTKGRISDPDTVRRVISTEKYNKLSGTQTGISVIERKEDKRDKSEPNGWIMLIALPKDMIDLSENIPINGMLKKSTITLKDGSMVGRRDIDTLILKHVMEESKRDAELRRSRHKSGNIIIAS